MALLPLYSCDRYKTVSSLQKCALQQNLLSKTQKNTNSICCHTKFSAAQLCTLLDVLLTLEYVEKGKTTKHTQTLWWDDLLNSKYQTAINLATKLKWSGFPSRLEAGVSVKKPKLSILSPATSSFWIQGLADRHYPCSISCMCLGDSSKLDMPETLPPWGILDALLPNTHITSTDFKCQGRAALLWMPQ